MKVIFLENVKGQGNKNDVKEVPDGYGWNFLIAKKLARQATDSELNKLKSTLSGESERKNALLEKAERLGDLITKTNLSFKLKAGKKGEIFGSIQAKDIEKKILELNLGHVKATLEKPLKDLGAHEATIDCGEGVIIKVTIVIEKE
jgi:large subunit ribosomal protein L9